MKFYFSPEGVICWNKKGWPEEMDFFDVPGLSKSDYEQALSRAKAESVPVRNQAEVRYAMSRHYIKSNGMRIAAKSIMWDKDSFYGVPDSEINKEWL